MTAAQPIVADLKARGFILHPLQGKIPVMKKWQELTATPEGIDKHVEAGGNVGAVCGKASNITCIDLDSFLFADEIFSGRTETLCAGRTEGRGHVYFKYNNQLPASKHRDLDIEILNDGNNIVLPGSKHPSGDIYQWKNPDAPILDMPAEVQVNLLHLFKTETELKRILAKCRHCFRDVIKRKPDCRGSSGREMMLAVCTDLKANGADEQHVKMFAKLMYKKNFDEGRTIQEWRNIDPAKTWTCETLKVRLPSYVDLAECEKCEQRRTAFQNRSDLVPEPRIIDPTATTDLSNAKRFVQLHQRNIRYVPLWNCWMVFDGKRWVEKKKDVQMVPLVEEMIKNIEREATSTTSEKTKDKLLKHANQTESEARIMACIRLAASQPEIQAVPDDFDNDKYLLNFQNGTVELKTETLREFKREDMITRICAVPYNPSAKRDLWVGFLDKIFAGDKDVINYMQKFFGMAFTGDVSEELFHILHGFGANGKTTMLTTINNILGKGYFKTIGVETLLKRGQKAIANDVARLQGARIVWANEPEYDDILTEGKIKKMVSKEPILGELKFKEPVEFDPEYSLIMSTNPKPKVRGVGKGWQRRIRFIPFDVEISDAEKDIHFADKLKEELPGIATWVIEGCLRWQKEGLNPPEKILVATSEFHQSNDKFADLFNNLYIKDIQAVTPFIILYTVYEAWATNEKLHIMTKNAFSRVISDRGFKDKTARFPDGRQFKGFIGISVTQPLLEISTEYLMAPEHEKQGVMLRMLPVTHQLSNLFHRTDPYAYARNNDNMSNIGTSIANIDNNESVTLVTLVTDIIKLSKIELLLQETYDSWSNQALLEHYKIIPKIKEQFELKIMSEFPELSENINVLEYIEYYCQGRDLRWTA